MTALRSRTNLFSKSNQNGAPSDMANAVMSQPNTDTTDHQDEPQPLPHPVVEGLARQSGRISTRKAREDPPERAS